MAWQRGGVGAVLVGCMHDGDLEGSFCIDDLTVTDEWVPVVAAPEAPPATVPVLHSATPNPFNPATTMAFYLPTGGAVRLQIHDLSGRLVTTLLDRAMPAGQHRVRWDGVDPRGQALPSGVYLVHLVANGAVANGTATLVR